VQQSVTYLQHCQQTSNITIFVLLLCLFHNLRVSDYKQVLSDTYLSAYILYIVLIGKWQAHVAVRILEYKHHVYKKKCINLKFLFSST